MVKGDGGGVGDSKGVGVTEMLESLVEGGSLRRVPRSLGASGKARVIPKNSEKCSFIMNCMKQNASDCRPPPPNLCCPSWRLCVTVCCCGSAKGFI